MTIKINDYAEFVDETTSDASKHHIALIGRLDDLKNIANIPRLLTASVGMLAESGEFAEISKKIIFQGKEFTEDERFHMKRELGDILWYWVQGCKALGFEPEDDARKHQQARKNDTQTDLRLIEVSIGK